MIFTLKQIYRLYFHINFQPFLQLKKWKCVGKIQLSTWVYFTWPVNVQMMKVREYFPNVTSANETYYMPHKCSKHEIV